MPVGPVTQTGKTKTMHEITAEYLASQGLSKDFPKRFFERIEITGSCWFWTGNRMRRGTGYGRIFVGSGDKCILTHRASWILHFGPIPKGFFACHDCPDGDCPYCVNPAHLWLGTNGENIKDMWSKGRANPCGGNYYRGEQKVNSKLTNEQVMRLRKMPRFRGFLTQQANLLGVDRATIANVINNRTYLV